MDKFVADANTGLRMLVGDADLNAAKTPEQRTEILKMNHYSLRLMAEVDEGRTTLVFDDSVIEEMVFTLRSYYKLPRDEISKSLLLLMEADNVETSELIRDTIRLYGTMNIDVVDIKLSLLSKQLNVPVLTWDRDFFKLNCEHFAPSDIINLEQTE
ncbi:hypothetical protein ACF3MZ_24245 [Paenibacillaceae bacterium WGS1546]|uniref:hypothetical protein n=1 Tax=Cohnella sp. WGS1546 TaxID=3366810 RepID=UPI00372D4E0D